MRKERQTTSFESVLKKLENEICKGVYSIVRNPIYKVKCGDEEYVLNPTCSIYRGKHNIADIYDISRWTDENKNTEIIKICRYTSCFDRSLYYLFFYDNGVWKGYHLYHSMISDSNIKFNYYDPFTEYIEKYSESLWTTSLKDILLRIKTSDELDIMNNIINDLKKKIENWMNANNEASFRQQVLDLVNQWQLHSLLRVTRTKFSLNPKDEDELFLAVLGKNETSKLYRYVSNSALKHIINDGTHAMSSIVCMNDKTECYYANDYVVEKDESDKNNVLFDTLENGIDYILNYDAFITSFSLCSPDELTMWRLYGDETKGVCIEYEVTNLNLPLGFYLAPVSYPRKDGRHLELDFIRFLSHELYDYHQIVLLRWHVWQRFFKPIGFNVEKEIRLLFCPQDNKKDNIKWVFANGIFSPIYMFSINKGNGNFPIYPLSITQITLGYRFPAKDVNKELIKLRLDEQGLNVNVGVSTIDYYRVNEEQ